MDFKRIAARLVRADVMKGDGRFLNMTPDQLDAECQKAYDAWVKVSDGQYLDPEENARANDEAGELMKSVLSLVDAGATTPRGLTKDHLVIMRDMLGQSTDEEEIEKAMRRVELDGFKGEFPETLGEPEPDADGEPELTGRGPPGGIQATCERVARRIAGEPRDLKELADRSKADPGSSGFVDGLCRSCGKTERECRCDPDAGPRQR